LSKEHRRSVTNATETYYESVTGKVRSAFEESLVWRTVCAGIRLIDDTYYAERGYRLFVLVRPPSVLTKPFASFVLKTFRRNVLDNPNWPNKPPGGWVIPPDWIPMVKDTVRTRFVVRYLDGVEYLVNRFLDVGKTHGLQPSVDYEAKEEGYYAAHLYLLPEFEIPREDWDTKRVRIPVEVQITTQIQENIQVLLHEYYEQRRTRPILGYAKWQWDYRSTQFCASYLGHILHYLEAMIVEVRDRHKQETQDAGKV